MSIHTYLLSVFPYLIRLLHQLLSPFYGVEQIGFQKTCLVLGKNCAVQIGGGINHKGFCFRKIQNKINLEERKIPDSGVIFYLFLCYIL